MKKNNKRKHLKQLLKKIVLCLSFDGLSRIDIDSFQIVSFDVFDTIIYRKDTNAEDVFTLVQKKYELIGTWNYFFSFKKARIEAEVEARLQDDIGEITLKNIYEHMKIDDEGVKDVLMKLEIEVEKEVSCVDKRIYRLYEECIKREKRIIFISDMYLPQIVIEDILKKNNVVNYEKIFVSSEKRVRKRDGKLFQYALSDLEINKKKIIHIGDDVIADYLKPRMMGMHAILYQRKDSEY